jgi:3-oxoacyl-[acyl-carrier protein] reductase
MRFQDRVVLITGGGRGIGAETARQFAAEGATVVVCDRDVDAAEQVVARIREGGGQADAHAMDVTDRAGVDAVVAQVLSRHGRVDVLVNNAGITMDATLVKMTAEQFDRVIDVNLKGVFNVTQAIVPAMVAAGKGAIVNASSVVGLHGNFGQTNYAATKAGVIAMTKTWSRELARKGITVNAVAPGFIQTEMTAAMPEKVLTMMAEKTPLGRLGQPADIARAYMFLASPDAAFITGHTLSVDGGLVL